MKHLSNYSEFNEGKITRGILKTINIVGTGLVALGNILTLNWDKLEYNLNAVPHGSKLINIFDTIKDNDCATMDGVLKKYKEKFGGDMVNDLCEVREFISSKSKHKNKEKHIEVVESLFRLIEEGLLEDIAFNDTLQDLKNQLLELAEMAKERGFESGIEYPEDWSDKPISKMDNDDLESEMDKALDNRDILKAKYIGKHIK